MIRNVLQRAGEVFAKVAMRIVPDPYVLAILLTFLAVIGALGAGSGPVEIMNAWFDGVWTLLTFMAAFSVTLMAGDAIAKSSEATRLLKRIAKLPDTPFQAVALTAFVAMVGGLISWAIGLIVGAVFARQVAYQGRQRGKLYHYPLLIAAGYTALMVWHSGITTSSGLIMADPALIPDTFPEYAQDGIPLSETVFSTANIAAVILLLVFVPPVMGMLHPSDEEKIEPLPDDLMEEMAPDQDLAADGGDAAVEEETTSHTTNTIADKLNNSRILGILIALFPAYYFVRAWFITGNLPQDLTLNSINAFFLFAAMVLWKTPRGIVDQMDRSSSNVAQIIFQFPFYAGISGLMTGTALGVAISGWFADIATPLTWPFIGLISAGIVNIFVPSGGGQWVAQGPILLETTQELGLPMYVAVVIEMFGDQLTNMVQPFFALPALALAGLRARDILGYTFVAMLVGLLVMGTTITIFAGLPYA